MTGVTIRRLLSFVTFLISISEHIIEKMVVFFNQEARKQMIKKSL